LISLSDQFIISAILKISGTRWIFLRLPPVSNS
jgi:hypothetical protein